MAENQDQLLERLKTLRQEAADYTTQQGDRVAAAVEEARAAWEAEDEAEDASRFEKAMAEIEAISADLRGFQPSGN